MRTSHFAQIQVIVPQYDYNPAEGNLGSLLKTVGMAQTLRIEDTFGATAENVVGTPLPVMAPGYQVTNVTIEKATIDGRDFRNLGAFNPLWAHVGSTYNAGNEINITSSASALDIPATTTGEGGAAQNNSDMYPFMFIISVRNKVSGSYTESNIARNDRPIPAGNPDNESARVSPFGTYVCILRTATISLSSQNVMIMDNMSAVARPLSGGWFNDAITSAYANQNTGLADIVNSALFGFNAQSFATSNSQN